jgi:RNA polymerase sigma-70 factor (ECF subfamily)
VIPTEASLLARAKAGDVDAFEQLSGAYADRLFMLLLRLLGDPEEAGEVAQEVMVRAWRGITRFQGRSSYFTWLYRIAVNEANRALAKRERQPPSVPLGPQELDLPTSANDDPARQAENNELRQALAAALAMLPPPLRTAIVLRDVEGFSTQEAAEIAGVSRAACTRPGCRSGPPSATMPWSRSAVRDRKIKIGFPNGPWVTLYGVDHPVGGTGSPTDCMNHQAEKSPRPGKRRCSSSISSSAEPNERR